MKSFAARVLPAISASLLALSFATPAQAAVTTIDLGAAQGYSAFIFGNVGSSTATGFHDVEGRLAVGGDAWLSGFSVGQKSKAGSSAPSIVTGGSLNIESGAIYNGGSLGKAVYGVNDANAKLSSKQWFESGTFSKGNASTLDFGAAKQQLTALSNDVSKLKPTGTVVFENSGYTLRGDINADVNIFNIDSSSLQNLTLDLTSIKSTAHIIINDSATTINLSGGYSSFSGFADRTLFNFANATSTSLTTYAWGSILAPNSDFSGTGHLEGTLVANSVSAKNAWGSQVEIGATGFTAANISAVPEPGAYAMLLAGLGVLFLRRRKPANTMLQAA
ncbi:collagen-binding domain-containing protein [Janthinobacterium sp.]|uniref:choice-of-anchor A family protein n=1 Tax=Janthinobacterium sp. TaxID=1871054 RepID=UPI002637D266|nr:collagen-binding domain-containing protein [Janthinobacterium sp.]